MTSLARLLAPHVAADPARAALRPEVPAQAPPGVRVLVVGGHSAHEPQTPLLDSAADEALPTWDDGRPAVMLLTSGSTGDPEAGVHSHRLALAWIHFPGGAAADGERQELPPRSGWSRGLAREAAWEA